MKAHSILLSLAAASWPRCRPPRPRPPRPPARSKSSLAKAPDKYVNVRDGFSASEKGQAANLDSLKQYLEERGNQLVPDGQKLTVTLTEVDLAGDFEPWRDPAMNDVRIVKDIYPPRIDLEFKLTGADGKVLKEGKRELRDLAFMMKLSIQRDDPFRHEKQLLNDWLTRELKPAK